MPTARLLQHIPVIGHEVLATESTPTIPTTEPCNTTQPLPSDLLPPRINNAILLGAGLPPIPAKHYFTAALHALHRNFTAASHVLHLYFTVPYLNLTTTSLLLT